MVCTACVAASIVNGDIERLSALLAIPRVRYPDKCWVEWKSMSPAPALDPLSDSIATSNPNSTEENSQHTEIHFSCSPLLLVSARDMERCSTIRNRVGEEYMMISLIDLALSSPGESVLRILMNSESFEMSHRLHVVGKIIRGETLRLFERACLIGREDLFPLIFELYLKEIKRYSFGLYYDPIHSNALSSWQHLDADHMLIYNKLMQMNFIFEDINNIPRYVKEIHNLCDLRIDTSVFYYQILIKNGLMNFELIAELIDHKEGFNCCDVSNLYLYKQIFKNLNVLAVLATDGQEQDQIRVRKLISDFISLGLFRFYWFDNRLMYIDSNFTKFLK